MKCRVHSFADLRKATGHKYKRRWKGSDGKWQYEYGEPDQKEATVSTVKELVSSLEQKYGVDLFVASGDPLVMNKIVVPKERRGEGIGAKVMNELHQYADKHGKTIALTPSTDHGASSVGRLKKFYKRFGYVENKGKHKDYEISETMYREPKKLAKAYKLQGETDFQGLDIAIENRKGSKRKWKDPNTGKTGANVMVHPYGYIRGVRGADGDAVDVFIGSDRSSKRVFIINQRRMGDRRKFDEHKVMLGFRSKPEARRGYLANYDGNGPKIVGSIRAMTIEEFKRWLEQGDQRKPA